jgi:plasmid stabilization system protein ParE
MLPENNNSNETAAPDTETLSAKFNRIVRKAQTAIFIERVVPKMMPPLYVTGMFLAVSWAGVWGHLPPAARIAGLLTLSALALASPRFVKSGSLRVSKDDAYKRIDTINGDPARPAETLGDKPASNDNPQAAKDWDLHLARTWEKHGDTLESGRSRPSIKAHDPYKLRFAVAAAVILTAAMAGDQHVARIAAAFDWKTPTEPAAPATPAAQLQLRGWIVPPDGITTPPLYLPELGGTKTADGNPITAHKNSTLTIATYDREAKITVNGTVLPLKRTLAARATSQSRQTFEYTAILNEGETVIQVDGGPSWSLTTTPDNAPTAKINSVEPGKNEDDKNMLQLGCTATDDFGVIEGEVVITLPNADPQATPLESSRIPPVALPAPSPCGP